MTGSQVRSPSANGRNNWMPFDVEDGPTTMSVPAHWAGHG